MQSRINVVFVCVVTLLLSGITLSHALSPLPEWGTTPRSVLEHRDYAQLPNEDCKAMFMDGRYQDAMEKFLSDAVPYRDDVLLANAAVQRAAIRIANLPFGYAAYPTFFASDRVVSSRTGAVYQLPAHRGTYPSDMIADAAARIAKLAGEHPNIAWAFYLIDRTDVSKANPAHALVSESLDCHELASMLRSSLSSSGVDVIDEGYEGEDSYLEAFFHTDHHMQVQGGVAMYEAIMSALGKEPLEFRDFKVAYDGPFYGSDARSGLTTELSDVVWDIAYEPSELLVNINGVSKDPSAVDKGWLVDGSYEKSSRFASVYAEYFHNDYKLVTIENPKVGESAGSLLLVSDSYDNSTSRLYAESYRRVYEIDVRRKVDLSAFIDEHPDIVDAAFVMHAGSLQKACVID